jgi:hypothetical protein
MRQPRLKPRPEDLGQRIGCRSSDHHKVMSVNFLSAATDRRVRLGLVQKWL